MVKIYKAIFYAIYRFLEYIEGGFAYQTNDNRAFETSVVLTVLEVLNLMTILSKMNFGNLFLLAAAVILAVNLFIFYRGDRYSVLVKEFKGDAPSFQLNVVVSCYFIATLLLFFIFVVMR